jgi:hypothetical protein
MSVLWGGSPSPEHGEIRKMFQEAWHVRGWAWRSNAHHLLNMLRGRTQQVSRLERSNAMNYQAHMEWQAGCYDEPDPTEEKYCEDCGLPLDQCKCEVEQ